MVVLVGLVVEGEEAAGREGWAAAVMEKAERKRRVRGVICGEDGLSRSLY